VFLKARSKAAPTEMARLIAESSVVVIATPGRNCFAPHIEGIVCQSATFKSNTDLHFPPPLPHLVRETEETFSGTDQRMILLLHQTGGVWDLVNRHCGWIPLTAHKVAYTRFIPGPDPLKRYSDGDFLRIQNDLLLPGSLAKWDHGLLSENAFVTWIRKEFAASHRTKF